MEYSLLIKRINKGLNPQEEREFQQWYFSSKDHQQYYQNLEKYKSRNNSIKVNTFQAWKKVKSRTLENNTRYWKYRIVAIIVIGFLSLPLYFFLTNELKKENQVVNIPELETSLDRVIFKDQNGNSLTFGNKDSTVAGKYYQASNNQLKMDKITGAAGINTVIVPSGKKFMVELSDGTKVTLNAKSKFEFPSSFINLNKRVVNLVYGEAYFEVTPAVKNEGKNFIVKNSNQDIEVVGTSFNIENYNQDKIVTTLIEGKINLLYGRKKVALNPGQQSIFKDHSLMAIRDVNVQDYIAWKDGVFLFKDETLLDIISVLSRWYNVETSFQNKELEEIKFNGKFKTEQKLENILDIIENTKRARFELNGNKIKVMQYQE